MSSFLTLGQLIPRGQYAGNLLAVQSGTGRFAAACNSKRLGILAGADTGGGAQGAGAPPPPLWRPPPPKRRPPPQRPQATATPLSPFSNPRNKKDLKGQSKC